MGWLKRLLLVGLLALAPSAAFAQCNGIFPANNVCGTVGGGFAGGGVQTVNTASVVGTVTATAGQATMLTGSATTGIIAVSAEY